MRLLLALSALVGLLAAAALSLAPAAADGHDRPELIISIVEDSDNVVPPGSVFNVRAQLRYDTPAGDVRLSEILDGSHLRLAGPLDWDDTSIGAAFKISPEKFGVPATELIPTDGAATPMPFDNNVASPGTDGTGAWPVAYDSRTLVAYAATTSASRGSLLIFDTRADPPAQVQKIDGTGTERLGLDTVTRIVDSRPVAVWDQDDSTAWIFAGAPDANTMEGKLYIYKLTYGASGATVGTPTVLEPPASEYTNRSNATTNTRGYYGRSVSISADGQTLAVGASGMNEIGAVYVYTMPDGADEDWSDLTYAVGVKVTAVQVPAWGTSNAATQPFLASSTGRTGANTDCDAYCSRVVANLTSHFGRSVELSADGATLVVGADNKRFPDTTPGGPVFGSGAGNPIFAGTAWVFTAPAGGWSAAPDATTGKTLIAAQATAAAWDPANNYSPGPAKRIESADAELTPAAWGATRTQWAFFGSPVNISADGETIVATARRSMSPDSRVYVFEKPAGGWATTDSPTATIVLDNDDATNDDLAGQWGTDVSHDGRRILIEDAQADRTTPSPTLENAGLVYVFDRPAAGWAASLTEDDNSRIFRSPTPQANGQFSAPLYNNAGTFAVFADTDYNGITGTAPKFFLEEGIECTSSTVDGDPKTTCTFELPNTDVTVPIGTPDGGFTISGNVAVRFSDGTEARNVISSLAASVGTVDELANVEFDFATNTMGDTDPLNDRPYPAVVAPGGATTLLLKLLNENGKASAKGAAASVLFSTARGALSARIGAAETEACGASGGSVCRLSTPATALTADNADNIRLTVTHPGANKAGSASIRVVVVNAAGRTFSVEPITLTFSGPPTALAITQPPTALLGYAPPHTALRGYDAPPPPPVGQIADDDQRNVATLVVSATDTAGNKAAVPTSRYTVKLTDPDGKTVALGPDRQVDVDWPLLTTGLGAPLTVVGSTPSLSAADMYRVLSQSARQAVPWINKWTGSRWLNYGETGGVINPGSVDFPIAARDVILTSNNRLVDEDPLARSDGNPQARVTILADADTPLAVGEYTLELSAGSGIAKLTATQTFSVTGGAAALELSADPTGDIAEGATVAITATATDANGEPVPDGTLVTFKEQSTGASATVVLLSQAKQRTRNGQATATLQAVGIGGAYVTAEADGVSGAQSITIAAPPPPPPAERVTSTAADAFTVWTGWQLISASQLLPNLEGVSRIRKQINGEWASYGETNGLLNSGSVDFIVGYGDVLWLSSD